MGDGLLVIFDWFVLSMRMQVILDFLFARPDAAPIWDGKKGEFRDWTTITPVQTQLSLSGVSGRSCYVCRGGGGGGRANSNT